MPLDGLSTNWKHGSSYQDTRNHLLKKRENDDLAGGNDDAAQPHRDHKGRLAIGYGYDIESKSVDQIARELNAIAPGTITDHHKDLLRKWKDGSFQSGYANEELALMGS